MTCIYGMIWGKIETGTPKGLPPLPFAKGARGWKVLFRHFHLHFVLIFSCSYNKWLRRELKHEEHWHLVMNSYELAIVKQLPSAQAFSYGRFAIGKTYVKFDIWGRFNRTSTCVENTCREGRLPGWTIQPFLTFCVANQWNSFKYCNCKYYGIRILCMSLICIIMTGYLLHWWSLHGD